MGWPAAISVVALVGSVAFMVRVMMGAGGDDPPPFHDCNLNGHRFEARYATEPPNGGRLTVDDSYSADEIADLVRLMTKRTYVCDVCVRCGQVAPPPSPAPAAAPAGGR